MSGAAPTADGSAPTADGSAIDAPGDARPRPHANCYWLLPGALLAGQHPGLAAAVAQRAALHALLDAGIRQWLDLTPQDEPLPDYRAALAGCAASRGLEVQVQRLPIVDFSVPKPALMRRILDTLHAALQAKQPIYLHCHGGIGRTGTVVGCWLVEQGCTPEQALTLLARKWQVMEKRVRAPASPETNEQRDFILNWTPGAGR